jgi:hypothetical protein
MKKLLEKIKDSLQAENIVKTLEVVCFTIGVLSIFFSLALMFLFGDGYDAESAKTQRLSIFVGLWAPTLIGIACYLKINSSKHY